MKVLWCWRCQMDIPMLDEDEYGQVLDFLNKDREPAASMTPRERLNRACQEYTRLTGFTEGNINAVLHHRLSRYGPPCTTCGKPLRTPQARHCAACGVWR